MVKVKNMQPGNDRNGKTANENPNLKQTKEQQDDRGEINLGGREFTGDSDDQQTSSAETPSMGTGLPVDERDNKNSETAEKS
jgi:hypothetical protein